MAAIVLSHKAKKKDPEISCATLQKLTDQLNITSTHFSDRTARNLT